MVTNLNAKQHFDKLISDIQEMLPEEKHELLRVRVESTDGDSRLVGEVGTKDSFLTVEIISGPYNLIRLQSSEKLLSHYQLILIDTANYSSFEVKSNVKNDVDKGIVGLHCSGSASEFRQTNYKYLRFQVENVFPLILEIFSDYTVGKQKGTTCMYFEKIRETCFNEKMLISS